MARRHDDDHRLCFAGGNQVVEDEALAADRAPRFVDVAGAVQQVQHRITIAARLVPGRRVDVHAAYAAERARVVVNRGDRAVRHVARVEDVRSGNDREAVDRRVRLAGSRIPRIDDDDAVGRLPDAVGSFRKLRRRNAAAADARNIARTAQLDFLRRRREHAEGHAAIGAHLRRGDGWRLRRARRRRLRKRSDRRCEQAADQCSAADAQQEAGLHHLSLLVTWRCLCVFAASANSAAFAPWARRIVIGFMRRSTL